MILTRKNILELLHKSELLQNLKNTDRGPTSIIVSVNNKHVTLHLKQYDDFITVSTGRFLKRKHKFSLQELSDFS